METVVNLGAFQDRFVSGLLYTMLEGLNDGEAMTLKAQNSFDEFLEELKASGIENLICAEPIKKSNYWELIIRKKSQVAKASGDCCGMCGGNS